MSERELRTLCGCRAHHSAHAYCYPSCDQAGCSLIPGSFDTRPAPERTDARSTDAAKFHAETLTSSFLAERLRHRPLPNSGCDRCSTRGPGVAVLVNGDSREWLCDACLRGEPEPPPRFLSEVSRG